MKRLCTICVRGGSKGIPGKNFRSLLGRPLVAHTVQHALGSGLFEGIVISSDSQELLDIGKRAGATWTVDRPPALATDESDKADAVLHAALEVERLTGVEFDTFVDLDATAPLRLPRHVIEAVALVEQGGAPNVFSACVSRRSPYFNMVERRADGSVGVCKVVDPPPVRRQDVPATYDMNASIYAWNRHAFLSSRAAVFLPGTQVFVMPEHTAFDMDSPFDFELIEFIYPKLQAIPSHGR